MRDAYYTPRAVAEEMVELGPSAAVRITDPAAGEGGLLEAARFRYPAAELHGFDIEDSHVQGLKARWPDWSATQLDLRDVVSRKAHPAWQRVRRTNDLVLLNPPYSYRGSAYVRVDSGGFRGKVSPATFFVLSALDLVSDSGSVVAILPKGILELEKDRDAWEWIATLRRVYSHREYSNTTFRGTRVKSELVSISGIDPGAKISHSLAEQAEPTACVELIRGRIPVHRAQWKTPGSSPFLHTTSLDSSVAVPPHNTGPVRLATFGNLLLMPRVGRPRPEQIRTVVGTQGIILSDCVFALREPQGIEMDELLSRILDQFEALRAAYSGPCAPHMTIARLKDFLATIGVGAHHVPASSPESASPVCLLHSSTRHPKADRSGSIRAKR